MQLFHAPASPFVRKIMVLLHETGNLNQVKIIAAGGTPLDAKSMPTDENPLGKIPALRLKNGQALFDSRVICRYLDDLFKTELYPEGAALWPVLTLEALADGMMDAAILMVYERRCRPDNMVVEAWVEGQWAKVDRGLAALEADWLPQLEAPLNMGQIALGCALAYLDFRHDAREWRQGRPGLSAWFEVFAQRASMVDSRPEG